MATVKQEAAKKRRELVLLELAKRGGWVSTEDWRGVGAEYGYDARGLGGFCVGDASVRKSGDGYYLTPGGWTLVGKAYRQTWEGKGGNPWRDDPQPLVINRGKLMSDVIIEMR